MQDENPYSAPQAAVELLPAAQELRLGGRWERLGAALIDSFIIMAVLLPLWFAVGYWDLLMKTAVAGQRPGWGWTLSMLAAGMAAYVLIQGYPLATAGQTWGKRLLKLKIVDLEGRKPSLLKLLAVRYFANRVIVAIPLVGPLYSIADPLIIFGKDRRCLHDHIAGTRVVVAE
jgi:uncharacterized RDD family membrane protein YckC